MSIMNAKPTELNETNFDEEVIRATGPVLVEFWSEGCPACEAMSPVLEAVAIKHAGLLKVGKVNVGGSAALASQFGVQSVPSLFLFKGGNVQERLAGVVTEKEISEKLASLP